MRALRTSRLTIDRVPQAYPIIQMVVPELTLEAWCRFAGALIAKDESEGGIVTVDNEQNYIVGLAAYGLEMDQGGGSNLIVDHFVAVDLIQREAVAQALVTELEGLAERNHCNAVHTHVPGSGSKPLANWLVELMQTRGHDVTQLLLRKSIAKSA